MSEAALTEAIEAGEAPPFREPWQARTFALVVALHRAGHFAWDAWVQTLAGEIAGAPQRGDETADAAYHRQFLAALERIVAARGLTEPATLAARKDAWRRAYINTPHGHAVDLAAADHHHDDDDDDHAHSHDLTPQRAPVAVSPPRSHAKGG